VNINDTVATTNIENDLIKEDLLDFILGIAYLIRKEGKVKKSYVTFKIIELTRNGIDVKPYHYHLLGIKEEEVSYQKYLALERVKLKAKQIAPILFVESATQGSTETKKSRSIRTYEELINSDGFMVG